MSKIIYPDKLKIGDTIGITAVSMSANEEKIDIAINNLKKFGFNIKETKNVRNYGNIVSSSAYQRAQELLELFNDKNVKYIISARGGEFLMEMLPYLDGYKEVIKKNPKWFQGFSDPSLINIYITTTFNIATVNFENISEYAMNPRFKNLDDSINFMISTDKEYVQNSFEYFQDEEYEDGNLKGYNLTQKNVYECKIEKCEFEGRIIGGCIDVISLISGTKLDNIENFVSQFSKDGIIWYIDNCELQPTEFYRRLWHFETLGYFKNLRGVLIGRSFTQYENNNDPFTFKDAVYRAFSKYDVPIIFNVDIGHIPPQMYIINGSYAKFEYDNGKGKLIQKLI